METAKLPELEAAIVVRKKRTTIEKAKSGLVLELTHIKHQSVLEWLVKTRPSAKLEKGELSIIVSDAEGLVEQLKQIASHLDASEFKVSVTIAATMNEVAWRGTAHAIQQLLTDLTESIKWKKYGDSQAAAIMAQFK